MCGIAGFVTSRPGDPQSNIVERMTTVLEHRGPDGFGYHQDAWAHLGHRRLSIIDVAAGAQPMANEDRSQWIVYNGEIFNHASIRPELEQAGHRYRTACDTETLVHAYEQFGPDSVKRYRGMFSFALWNQKTRTLFCARDRLGIKPFYYYWDGSLFAFASEIKGLLQHPEISTKFEASLLPEYLAFGYTSGEETLFAGIRKLMPGHHLTLELGGDSPRLTIKQYWDVPESAPVAERDDASWIAELRQRLEETVRMRLMSDVPLGVFLSGGIDSSLIAALMRGMVAEKIKTFSVGYAEAPYSELGYAAQVARSLDTDHHEVRVSMDDFFSALPRLIWHEDEPIAWPSSVPLYFVSKLAAHEVKVVLTGEGSDELFGGYGRYGYNLRNERHMAAWRVAPAWMRAGVRRGIQTSPLLSAELRRKIGHTALGREDSVASLLLDNFYGPFSKDQRARLHAEPEGAAYRNYLRYFDARPNASRLSRMLYADQKTYLVELLMKQDQMSMAASIESRVPLLDHTLVEFASTIPDRLKIHNGTAKYILKKAVEGLLPDEIIHRKKMGFPTPMKQWLKDPRAERFYTLLRDPNRLLAAHLDGHEIERLIQRQQSGQEDCTDRLWNLINLQIWGDLFLLGKQDEWRSSEAVLAPAG